MIEDLYLLYSHYRITDKDKSADIIFNTARISYGDFCRRLYFQNRVPTNQNFSLERKVEHLLVEELPVLIETDNQESFDEKHHEICRHIIRVYDVVGGQSYGVAQRWLNLTLLNLTVVERILHTDYWNIAESRKYFHVPVERYLLEAATSRITDRFKHGLQLKMAPLKHTNPEDYQMDWYSPEKTNPFENWEYAEYIEFQKSVRERINESFSDRYKDCLDWAINAFLEVSQMRNNWQIS